MLPMTEACTMSYNDSVRSNWQHIGVKRLCRDGAITPIVQKPPELVNVHVLGLLVTYRYIHVHVHVAVLLMFINDTTQLKLIVRLSDRSVNLSLDIMNSWNHILN